MCFFFQHDFSQQQSLACDWTTAALFFLGGILGWFSNHVLPIPCGERVRNEGGIPLCGAFLILIDYKVLPALALSHPGLVATRLIGSGSLQHLHQDNTNRTYSYQNMLKMA
ncbi:hypothetical protein BGW36DRAFT_376339 [Talaromyces proteolyticus]|uniref:Uncharacterized protein n=1 Tax=Talaromyces proteolyticus TaxID=1131652 RepID=A0AAD4KR27_9EURO|nr:uncharacterized protein BGW36DRAFT_376339 [Talaromyces proteolyticus]KAH8698555.1 hypothetical protein BGW36DRAFT_376339 [Talaromyces proteolyticus]